MSTGPRPADDAGDAPPPSDWPAVLTHLEGEVLAAQDTMAHDRAEEIAAWGRRFTDWFPPSGLGPLPEELRERAELALDTGDRTEAAAQIQHAQDIVFELRESLRIDAWEGGPRLAALYNWLTTELMTANIKADVNRVTACQQVVEPLRDAWRQAASAVDAGMP